MSSEVKGTGCCPLFDQEPWQDKTLQDLHSALLEFSDEEWKKSSQRYFKESVEFLGVKGKDVQRLDREYYSKIKDRDKEFVFSMCEELWQSPYFEENIIACNWAHNRKKEVLPDDLTIFEKWLDKYVNNWATCDTLCNHTIGDLVMMYPEKTEVLKRWTKSENRWMKRGAAVTLIVPARKGLFLDDIFEIASIMLHDRDDMVQKGYGWMLKAASEAHQKKVFDFVTKHKATMPRTALRYAIEKMPAEMKKEAMRK